MKSLLGIYLKHVFLVYSIIVAIIYVSVRFFSAKPETSIEAVGLFTFYGGGILCFLFVALYYIFDAIIRHFVTRNKA